VTPARILAVDDDLWIQRTTSSVLGRAGHQVSLAGDAPTAFAIASKIRPELIVTSATLPALEGWSWWERLRALPACADLPILFLVPAGEPGRPIPGESPHDRRLAKPFRVEDLERAVGAALAERAPEISVEISAPVPRSSRAVDRTKPSAGHRPLSALRGELSEISLPSVLTVLEMEHKTGLLLVERGRESGRLFIREGRVIRAAVEPSALTGSSAVYALLFWQEGAFDFLAGDVGGVDEIQTSTTYLLMEGARRFDEANEARRLHGDGGPSSPEAPRPPGQGQGEERKL
jgi:two-component system OmpR family response regulator